METRGVWSSILGIWISLLLECAINTSVIQKKTTYVRLLILSLLYATLCAPLGYSVWHDDNSRRIVLIILVVAAQLSRAVGFVLYGEKQINVRSTTIPALSTGLIVISDLAQIVFFVIMGSADRHGPFDILLVVLGPISAVFSIVYRILLARSYNYRIVSSMFDQKVMQLNIIQTAYLVGYGISYAFSGFYPSAY